MMKVITIDRELGSGAADIVANLASRVRWNLWNQLLTTKIAGILGCDCPAIEERERRRETAGQGNCVIVGRGSAYYLQSRLDAFHVFVCAPFEEKTHRLRGLGKSEEEARELVGWPSREIYHLMINSSLGDHGVVEMILNSLEIVEALTPVR